MTRARRRLRGSRLRSRARSEARAGAIRAPAMPAGESAPIHTRSAAGAATQREDEDLARADVDGELTRLWSVTVLRALPLARTRPRRDDGLARRAPLAGVRIAHPVVVAHELERRRLDAQRLGERPSSRRRGAAVAGVEDVVREIVRADPNRT